MSKKCSPSTRSPSAPRTSKGRRPRRQRISDSAFQTLRALRNVAHKRRAKYKSEACSEEGTLTSVANAEVSYEQAEQSSWGGLVLLSQKVAAVAAENQIIEEIQILARGGPDESQVRQGQRSTICGVC